MQRHKKNLVDQRNGKLRKNGKEFKSQKSWSSFYILDLHSFQVHAETPWRSVDGKLFYFYFENCIKLSKKKSAACRKKHRANFVIRTCKLVEEWFIKPNFSILNIFILNCNCFMPLELFTGLYIYKHQLIGIARCFIIFSLHAIDLNITTVPPLEISVRWQFLTYRVFSTTAYIHTGNARYDVQRAFSLRT